MNYLLLNGNFVFKDKIRKGSIEIYEGKIQKILTNGNSHINFSNLKFNIIDCTNKFILPGVIDLHTHLRDMDQSYKETIDSGTKSALYNGMTTIFTMPNTVPKLSTSKLVENYINLIKTKAWCNVGLYGGIGPNFNINELIKMKSLGIFGLKFYPGDTSNLFHLDWDPILDFEKYIDGNFNEYNIDVKELINKFNNYFFNKNNYKNIINKCKNWFILFNTLAELDLIALIHPDIPIQKEIRKKKFYNFLNNGFSELKAHSLIYSKLHELLSILYFHFLIMNSFNQKNKNNKILKVHFCHVSCSESVNLITKLFSELDFIKFAIEITPHHLLLHNEIQIKNPNFAKVLPPLRNPIDMKNLQKEFRNNKISFISTDHAPHSIEEKNSDFFSSPPGFPEFDTYILYFLNTIFNNNNELCDLVNFVKYSSSNPANWIGLNTKGIIEVGYDADLLIVENTNSYNLNPDQFLSKSKLTPYPLYNLKLKISEVFINGIPISINFQKLNHEFFLKK